MTSEPSLFGNQQTRPLADRIRPSSLIDVVGQNHLLEDNGQIGRLLKAKNLTSMILWGPPGSGKTTIARLLAKTADHIFIEISAILSGVNELRKVFERASLEREAGIKTILFVDEIHRFNRAQQDSFLPYIEDGTIILIGATTENPSFELISPLLSRTQVIVLRRLNQEALEKILIRAEREFNRRLPITENAKSSLLNMADGDGRYLLNIVETIFMVPEDKPIDRERLAEIVQNRMPLYDRIQDQHYNLISALHKSLRSSDVDAALYWLARMLSGGEDPKFLLRRLVRFASEDIGLADPNALLQAIAGWESYTRLGSPEGELAIAQVVVYLASAPKSNAVYIGFESAAKVAKQTGSRMPPKSILNPSTSLLEKLGYGEGYQYDHDNPEGFAGQNCFPEDMKREKFYNPVGRGFEYEVKKRLAQWEKIRANKTNG